MDRQKEINEKFKEFALPPSYAQDYTNANEFSKSFKKCSVLNNANSTYSSSSGCVREFQHIRR